MEQPVPASRRRSDGSVRESLFFPVQERNEQQRLEALTQHPLQRSEPWPKRWTWGGSSDTPEEYENALAQDLSALPCISDETPCSPHRSPYKASLSHTDHGKASNGSPFRSADSTKVEAQTGERSCTSLLSSSTLRRPESPATQAQSQGPGTPRRVRSFVRRGQSPCPGGLYPPSPLKNGPSTPGMSSRKQDGEEKGPRSHVSAERKSSRTETPERKVSKSSNRDLAGDKGADASPVTPTGKPVAGTTDAEEASRLLAERRRQARLQKEEEERLRREQEEEERRREEEQRRRQEEELRQLEEQRQREELEHRREEEEKRRHKEQRWRELQAQLEREKEEVESRVQKEAERRRYEREMLRLQENEERLQRKKRIEEIMKRTRKTDTEVKKDLVWVEPLTPVSLQQTVSSSLHGLTGAGQVHVQVDWRVRGQNVDQMGGMTAMLRPDIPPLPKLQPVSPTPDHELLGAEELADEVQAMDVSPVSKEELISLPEFLPVSDIQNHSMSNNQALEDLLDLTDFVSNPTLSAGAGLGDCNKNLIEGFCPSADSQFIQTLAPSSDELSLP